MMNKEQAIEVLIRAAQVATEKGAFDLKSAGYISAAVESLSIKKDTPESIDLGSVETKKVKGK